MANISWVENNSLRFTTKEEIGITVKGKKGSEHITITIDPSVLRNKFDSTKRMLIGYDNALCRLYLVACDEDMSGSYSVAMPSPASSGFRPKVQITASRFKVLDIPYHSLQGGYKLLFDEEEHLWYVDVSQNVKFASRKLKVV